MKESKKRKAGERKVAALRVNDYHKEVLELLKSVDNYEWHHGHSMVRCEVLGAPLVEKYAWAVPDNKALEIIKHFAPIIELGAGGGYWAYLLREMGVDIVAVDKYNAKGAKTYTEVIKGEPKILKKKEHEERVRFLSYPDDRESMSMECLEYFQGDTIIHVGELAITGTKAGGVQRPWGKTSCSEFQVALMADFHCVVRHRLPSFPTSCDYLTVWKRTPMMITGDSQGEEEEADEEGEDEGWAVIPAEEVLELGSDAAPGFEDLL